MVKRGRERSGYVYREEEGDHLVIKLEMKESGSVDLKALRKDHILPINGQPRSPGGREYLFSPSLTS